MYHARRRVRAPCSRASAAEWPRGGFFCGCTLCHVFFSTWRPGACALDPVPPSDRRVSVTPHAIRRQIRALDSMIKKLKSNRHKCQVAIDEDEEQLKWIAKEEASIHVRLDPLAERLREREATAERVRKQIDEAVALFNGVRGWRGWRGWWSCHGWHVVCTTLPRGLRCAHSYPARSVLSLWRVHARSQILSTTNSRITKTRMKAANHRKTEATEELRAARGFSAEAADSPHRTRPKGYFKRGKK